jgi:hypothetical protein
MLGFAQRSQRGIGAEGGQSEPSQGSYQQNRLDKIICSPSSICQRRMLNMLPDMMRATHRTRLICLGVIATLFCAVVRVQPVWAEDEDEPSSSTSEPAEGPADFKDPTIVTDDSTSTPDVVINPKKPEKKPIENPVWEKWWFWATVVGVAGVFTAGALWPLQKKAPGCGSGAYPLGCIGDGRGAP